MVSLLRERNAYEMNLFGDAGLVTFSAATFPCIHALVGYCNPKAAPKLLAQGASISPLARTVFEAIQKHGPLNKERTRKLGGRGKQRRAGPCVRRTVVHPEDHAGGLPGKRGSILGRDVPLTRAADGERWIEYLCAGGNLRASGEVSGGGDSRHPGGD